MHMEMGLADTSAGSTRHAQSRLQNRKVPFASPQETEEVHREVLDGLSALRDEEFRDFASRLVPTIPKAHFLGVRAEGIKAMARKLESEGKRAIFFATLPHFYHEENLLHAMLLSRMNDAPACLQEVRRFLPYVTNWAVADAIAPRVLLDYVPQLRADICTWLHDSNPYAVRVAIFFLMHFALGKNFSADDFGQVTMAAIHASEMRTKASEGTEDLPYIEMMAAWYFQEALVMRYEEAYSWLASVELPAPVFRMTIQKALDSRRLDFYQKDELKDLRDQRHRR